MSVNLKNFFPIFFLFFSLSYSLISPLSLISFAFFLFSLLIFSYRNLKRPSSHSSWNFFYGKKLLHSISGELILRKSPKLQETRFNVNFILGKLFLFILFFNIRGLNIFFDQLFIRFYSLPLFLLGRRIWISRYFPIFRQKKRSYFTLFLVGDIGHPSLSFLLSNIEILTQFFRPITLIARLWVNIWVGHLIIRSISSLIFLSMGTSSLIILRILLTLILFFLFECGIIFLQSFVFRYLVGVYWMENLHNIRIISSAAGFDYIFEYK